MKDGFHHKLARTKNQIQRLKYSVCEMKLRPVQACGYAGKGGRIERNW